MTHSKSPAALILNLENWCLKKAILTGTSKKDHGKPSQQKVEPVLQYR